MSAKTQSAPPPDPTIQELRIALVMSGGVSLAVWIGGVTTEIHRLLQKQGIYGELLGLTHSEARVDIISGSSAGGLNGGFLAFALARGLSNRDFQAMRDVWLESGDLARLLRSPHQPDPPSLLQGDAYFKPEIAGLLERWRRLPQPSPAPGSPVRLIMTATTLEGMPRTYLDDFGEAIHEADHAATFRFDETALAKVDAVDKLALAARSTASFPGAFEASYCPVGQSVDDRPDMRGVASFARSRFTIDGGVLVNKPLRPALESIFEQPAERDVRRVIAYVSPHPVPRREPPADALEKIPNLAGVVSKSLFTLPSQQTIGRDIEELRQHNARVRDRRRVRARVLAAAARVPLAELAAEVFEQYRETRARRSMQGHLDSVAHSFVAGGAGESASFPYYDYLLEAAVEERMGIIPDLFDKAARESLRAASPDSSPGGAAPVDWHWGIGSVEYSASVVLELIAGGTKLAPVARDGLLGRLGSARREVHRIIAVLRAIRAVDVAFWQCRREVLETTLEELISSAGVLRRESARSILKSWATGAFGDWPRHQPALEEGSDQKLAHDAYVESLKNLAASLARGAGDPDDPLGELRRQADLSPDEPRRESFYVLLRGLQMRIADLLLRADEDLEKALAAGEAASFYFDHVAGSLRGRRALLPEADDDVELGGDPAVETAYRLLALSVVQMTLGCSEVVLDEPVDLIQISSDVRCELDSSRQGGEAKLAGIQLAHFGAFYKRSWRANDWMWGRLDGAARLALVLLDPRRLRRTGMSVDEIYQAVGHLATGRTASGSPLGARSAADLAALDRVWKQRYATSVHSELVEAFGPASHGAPDFKSLPHSAAAVAYALQTGIAQEELGRVADEVEVSRREGGSENAEAASFRRQVEQAVEAGGEITADDAPDLLAHCRVGEEKLAGDELDEDLFTRTATQAGAVAASAASGERSGLGFLRGAMRAARTMMMALYLLGRSLTSGGHVGLAVVLLAVSLSGAVIAAALMGVDVPGLLLGAAGVVVAAWLVLVALRGGGGWTMVPLVLAAAAILLSRWGQPLEELTVAGLLGRTPALVFVGLLVAAVCVALWWGTREPVSAGWRRSLRTWGLVAGLAVVGLCLAMGEASVMTGLGMVVNALKGAGALLAANRTAVVLAAVPAVLLPNMIREAIRKHRARRRA